jgi:hypothetical protein
MKTTPKGRDEKPSPVKAGRESNRKSAFLAPRIVVKIGKVLLLASDLLTKSISSMSSVFDHRKGRATWLCLVPLLL